MNSVKESPYIRWVWTPLVSGIVGASIVFALLHGLSLEAFASISVALTTLVLAYFTRQSVAKTDEVIRNDKEGQRLRTTLELISQFQQVPIQVTREISLTAQTAASNLRTMADMIDVFKALKTEYEASPEARTDRILQFITTVDAQTVFGNFFLNANHLLRLGVLDARLFMNSFAMTFIPSYEAMKQINAIVNTIKPPTLERLDEMQAACEYWLSKQQSGHS